LETLVSVFNLGLLLLIVGWLLQLVYLKKGKKEISRNFLAVYGFGIIAIVFDGLMGGLIIAPILNLLVLLVIIVVMIKTFGGHKRK